MTDFQPLRDKIWDAAKADDRPAFEKSCEDLMIKCVHDLFRIGWNIYPKKIDDVYDLLDDIATWCHERWQEAMECGDAPYEDVSPGEGFLLVKKVIQNAIGNNSKEGIEHEEQAAEDKDA